MIEEIESDKLKCEIDYLRDQLKEIFQKTISDFEGKKENCKRQDVVNIISILQKNVLNELDSFASEFIDL